MDIWDYLGLPLQPGIPGNLHLESGISGDHGYLGLPGTTSATRHSWESASGIRHFWGSWISGTTWDYLCNPAFLGICIWNPAFLGIMDIWDYLELPLQPGIPGNLHLESSISGDHGYR